MKSLFDRPYVLLSLSSLFWGINAVLGRYIANEIPAALLAQIRWVGASIIVLPLAWPHLKRDWPAMIKAWPVMLMLSFSGITVYNTVAYYGLHFTEAINALLMQSATPLMIAVWSLVLFRDRLTGNQFLGILVSLVGVLTIVVRGDPRALLAVRFNQGDLWICLALTSYAFYTAMLRRRPSVHYLSMLAFTFIAGLLMLLPVTILEYAAGYRMTLTTRGLAVLGFLVLFPSVIAYICFNRGVQLIGANRSGPFFHLITVFGSIAAIILLGERPALYHGVGFALIIAGIFIAQRGSGRVPEPAES